MTKFGLYVAGLAAVLGASSALAQVNTSTATANGSTTIIRPITITKNTDLSFGRIVRPATGAAGTVAIANTADTVAAAGGAVALTGITTTRAKFTISGEQAVLATLTVPTTFTITNPAADTLTVTLSPDQTSPLTLGASDTTLYVGGSFPLTSTSASGIYSGTFNVTVAYQ